MFITRTPVQRVYVNGPVLKNYSDTFCSEKVYESVMQAQIAMDKIGRNNFSINYGEKSFLVQGPGVTLVALTCNVAYIQFA